MLAMIITFMVLLHPCSRASVLAKILTFMLLVYPCSRKLSPDVSMFRKFHALQNGPHEKKHCNLPCFRVFRNVQNIGVAGQPAT